MRRNDDSVVAAIRGKVKQSILIIALVAWVGLARAAEQEDPGKTATCLLWKHMTAIDQSRTGGSLRQTWVNGYLIGLVAMNARYKVPMTELWPGALSVASVAAEIDISCRTLSDDAMLPIVIMDMVSNAKKKF